jgi:hypothetical protein
MRVERFPGRWASVAVILASVALLSNLADCPRAYALDLSGTLTSSLYTWDAADTSSENGDHARFHTTLVTNLTDIGSPQLSFHGQFQGSTDLTADNDDTRTRIARSYIKWRPDRTGTSIRLGRVFTSGGVLPAAIDGFAGSVGIGRYASVYGCAGAVVPTATSPELADWDDSHILGASVRGLRLHGTRFGLGFWRRTRKRVDLPDGSAWSEITSEDLAEQILFFEGLRHLTSNITAGVGIQYDEPNSRLRRAHVKLPVSISTEFEIEPRFLYRRPYIDANSIFSVFGQEPISEYGVNLRYAPRDAQYGLYYAHTEHHDDSSDRVAIRARYHGLSLGIRLNDGYAGEAMGVSGSHSVRLCSRARITPSVSYTRFRFSGVDRKKNETFSSSVVLNTRLAHRLTLDIEAQGLSQGIRSQPGSGFIGYNHDIRFLLRLRYVFHVRGSGNI